MKRNEARVLAIKNVYQMLITKENMQEVISQYESDNEFLFDLCFGVEKHLEDINEKVIANIKTGWTLKRINVIDHAILLVASYELLYTSTPNEVIINEAIEIAKIYCDDDRYKFINGILDKIE